jgi:hypothetical protein
MLRLAVAFFLLLVSSAVGADPIKCYMGFTLERMFGSPGTDVLYSRKGVDNSDQLTWQSGAPPAGSPYDYIYDGAANYGFSSGMSASFEGGIFVNNGLFVGFELLYANYNMDDSNQPQQELNTDLVAALISGLYNFRFSEQSSLGLYIGAGVGVGGISLQDSTYVLSRYDVSSNPAPIPASTTPVPGAYVVTDVYPKGSISEGRANALALQLRGGASLEIENDVFVHLGLMYLGLSEVRSLSSVSGNIKKASVILEDDNGAGGLALQRAEVDFEPFGLEISPFTYGNFGVELSMRVAFSN